MQIDERGAVVDATLVTRIHPSYDNQLLKMARTWKFKPATRNGVPIPCEGPDDHAPGPKAFGHRCLHLRI